MKIKYDEIQKCIDIDDNLKTQYWLVNVVAVLTIFNSVIFPLFVLDKRQFQYFGFFWIIIGLVTVTLLTYRVLKKSASQKIRISEIKNLGERNLLGRKTLEINLKNGKSRDLVEMKKHADILKTKALFQEIGIPVE